MKMIGVLIDSIYCSKYLYDTVDNLYKRKDISIVFLLNNREKKELGIFRKLRAIIKTKGFLRFLDLVVFKIVTNIEKIVLATINNKIKQHYETLSLNAFEDVDTIKITPIYSTSGIIVKYSKEDIKHLNLHYSSKKVFGDLTYCV